VPSPTVAAIRALPKSLTDAEIVPLFIVIWTRRPNPAGPGRSSRAGGDRALVSLTESAG